MGHVIEVAIAGTADIKLVQLDPLMEAQLRKLLLSSA